MTENTQEQIKPTQGRRRILKGIVTSTRMNKTVIVRVERKKRHPLYVKIIKIAKKYHVHDEDEIARDGDLVSIEATRPLSKTKRWRLKEILEKAK